MHLNKRRKLDVEQDQEYTSILSEIDVEIGLRQRLLETLQSRITWALLLQESLNQDFDSVSDATFKDAALDALNMIEAPSDILFTRENILPVAPHILTAQKGRPPPKEKPITRSQKSKFIYLRSRDPPKIFLLRCPICHRSAFTSLQGLYNHARISHSIEWGSHEECVIACAVPQQDLETELDLENGTDISGGSGIMPGVKGLFQMAVEGRQRPGIAALLGGEDAEMNRGESMTGSVHLTRTLGLHGDSPALAPFLGKEVKRKCIRVWDEDQEVDISSFSGDEGHRKSRWKMPYMPRSAPRPEMNEHIIITNEPGISVAHSLPTSNNDVFIGSRFHISCRVTLTDSSLFIPEEQRPASAKYHTHKWMLSIESASYSIDLTTVLSSLTVSSSSSSQISLGGTLSLTTSEPPFLVVGTTSEPFLAKVELLFNPSTSGQGQNGQKVILDHWVGLEMIGTNKLPTKGDEQVVDIDLDKDTVMKPAKTGYTPVNSKIHWEELRTTSVPPEQHSVKTELGLDNGTGKDALDSYEAVLLALLPKFPMVLKDVSKSTTRATISPAVPDKLIATPQQLKTMVVGRRKAIEWARARALHEAYSLRVQARRENQEEFHPLPPLTVGDVFAWLEDEGHFVREREDVGSNSTVGDFEQLECCEKGKLKGSEQSFQGRWCRICGLGLWAHGIDENASVSLSASTPAPSTVIGKTPALPRLKIRLMSGRIVGSPATSSPSQSAAHHEEFVCQIIPEVMQRFRMPIVDIERVLGAQPHLRKQVEDSKAQQSPSHHSNTSLSHPKLRSRVLIESIEPSLLSGVHQLVNSLQLRTFSTRPSSATIFPLPSLGSSPSEVEQCLSPYAYLALAMTRFVRFLTTNAVDAEQRDKDIGVGYMFRTQNRDVGLLATTQNPSKKGRGATSGSSGNKKKDKEKSIRVLTPMHILSGVASSYVRASTQPAANLDTFSISQEILNERDRTVDVAIAVFGCLSRLGVAKVDEEKAVDQQN